MKTDLNASQVCGQQLEYFPLVHINYFYSISFCNKSLLTTHSSQASPGKVTLVFDLKPEQSPKDEQLKSQQMSW